MQNLLKRTAAAGGALCCALAAHGAGAQNPSNNQLLNAGLKHAFSATDVKAMMAEFSIGTADQPYEGDETATIIALTPGGARFLISLFQCENAATGEACKGAAIFTGLSNAGVTYDELNDFNSNANVTRVVNVSEQNIIVFGTQLFFSGGIGWDNFKYVTELFLADMQGYVEAKTAGATTVSAEIAPAKRSKIDNLTGDGEGAAARPRVRKSAYDLDDALGAAISNTWDVRFAPSAD